MIEKVRRKWKTYDNQKIMINEYFNPYITKLNIKMFPPAKIEGSRFLSPFDPERHISLTQSLPLWSNQRIRFGLLWNQQLARTYNMTNFGSVIEYRINKETLVKLKSFFINEIHSSVQVSKSIRLDKNRPPIIISGSYSFFYESENDIYHSAGVGAKINGFNASIVRRNQLDTNLYLSYQKKLRSDLFLKVQGNLETQQLKNINASVGIGYYLGRQSSAWIKNYVNFWDTSSKLSIEFEVNLKEYGTAVASVQYRQKSIFYFGYKCPSFNIVFPILAIDSPIPMLVAGTLFAIRYLRRKKIIEAQKKQQNKKEIKTVEQRGGQMKLIGEKANEIYKKEESKNGLLIEEAYVGPSDLLSAFLKERNRGIELNRNEQYKQKIYDLTVCFRFYVQKGILSIPRGTKSNLLGFYQDEEQKNQNIFVKYRKDNEEKERIFSDYEPIQL